MATIAENQAVKAADKGEAILYLCNTILHGDREAGCWEWPYFRLPNGYGRVAFGGQVRPVPRVVFAIEHGHWPEVCRHTCDNPPCFNPDHLLDGTTADNMRDKVARGRQRRGEKVPNSRLTEADVYAIRELLATGLHTLYQIGDKFSVSASTVLRIRDGICWGWLPRNNTTDKAGS